MYNKVSIFSNRNLNIENQLIEKVNSKTRLLNACDLRGYYLLLMKL